MRAVFTGLTAILAVSGLAAAAQDAIRGRVLDAQTDAPIRSATVRLLLASTKTLAAEVSTDQTGLFAFDNPQQGAYVLAAEKPLYVDLLPPRAPSKMVSVPGKEEPVTLYLTRTVVIAGHIADSSGRPPRGVRIQAMARRADRSGMRLAPQGSSVQPGPNGEFRLFGLPPDRYTLAVIPPTSMEGSGSAPVYFPGVTDPGRAEFFSLAPGENRLDVNFTIDSPAGYAVAGTVAGIPPDMAGRMAVSVLSTGMPIAVRTAMVDKDGRFLLAGVPPGQYELIAVGPVAGGYSTFGPSAGPNPRRGQLRIEVSAGDVRDIQIALREPFAVEGKVAYDRPADAGLACHDGAEIRLVAADSAPRSGPAARISRESAFVLKDVWPGNYGVVLSDLKGACSVKEIRAGGAKAQDGVISMRGEADERITVTFSAKSGKMDGAAKTEGNQPCPGAVVLLTPAGASGAWAGETLIAFAGDEGRYAFERIPPGRYRAMAMRRVTSNEYLDPSFWSERRSFSFEFEVEPGSVTTADIRVAK